MNRDIHAILTAILLIICSAAVAFAEPIRWTAPMNDYPTQWYPSAPPPQYNNQYGYGYQNPYSGYGYANPGYYQGGQGGFSGNPYYYYGQ